MPPVATTPKRPAGFAEILAEISFEVTRGTHRRGLRAARHPGGIGRAAFSGLPDLVLVELQACLILPLFRYN